MCNIRQRSLLLAWAVMMMAPAHPPSGLAQITKGHQILIQRGLQVQGMVSMGDGFSLSNYQNTRYNSIHWLWDSNPSWMGVAPGFPWSRWVGDETKVPPQGAEGPYLSQLVSIQLGDEWNLNDDATRTRAVNWFNAIRANFPNTILYMNNYGGQVGDAQLGDFITRARPDMLCFDTYPWHSDYTTRSPIARPSLGWYGDLRRYREHAKANNLPLAAYIQTFHAVQDWDQTVFRDPSPSELRLNHSASLAFGAKVLIDFTYNTGASSLFNGGGSGSPTALVADKTDTALRARNLGRALVGFKPIADAPFPDLRTTGMMFIRGRNATGTPHPIPIGFVADPQTPTANTDWAPGRNDPYLTSWAVTNKGTRNSGQPGDVIVSWFKPLDESLDGPFYTDTLYLMVVNALTDPTGTAADCLQEIRLNFVFTNGITGVVLLDPVSGQLQTNTLPSVDGQSQLVLNLNGGDAALFKFADGAPFVGWPVPTNAGLTLVPAGSSWRYLDDGSSQGTAWHGTNFNDGAWPSGAAPLGYGDGDEATLVRSNRANGTRIITTYFRHRFPVTDPAFFSNLTGRVLRDDGAIVYLNGVEVFRSNMPSGPIQYETRATSAVGGGDESTNFFPFPVNPALLIPGTNLLAVEIHQVETNSSDISFDLELSGTGNLRPTVTLTSPADGALLALAPALPLAATAADNDGTVTKVEFFIGEAKVGQDTAAPFTLTWSNTLEGLYTLTAIATDDGGRTATSAPVTFSVQPGLVVTGSVWKYLDLLSNQGTAWRQLNFNDSTWTSGPAQLGFGDGDEATLVASNRQITTYFRRRFAVSNAAPFTNLLLRVLRDDGAVAYLNGAEVFRNNMPAGAITFTTLASANALPEEERTVFHATNVNPSLLLSGTNVLAVEVHQASTNSSDLSFDLELIGLQSILPPALTIRREGNEALLAWPAFTGLRLESSASLDSPNWLSVPNSVLVTNGQNTVVVALAGSARFFRLR